MHADTNMYICVTPYATELKTGGILGSARSAQQAGRAVGQGVGRCFIGMLGTPRTWLFAQLLKMTE